MIGGTNGGEAGARVVATCLLAAGLLAAPGGQGGGVREAWLALREDVRPMRGLYASYCVSWYCVSWYCVCGDIYMRHM
jgi:hypothetical protein